MQTSKLIIWLVVLLALLVVLLWLFPLEQDNTPTACTLEAKLCPDGSYVGRTRPNCEFAACPGEVNDNDGWLTATDQTTGTTFQYPTKLSTTYITAIDWPPQLSLQKGPFICAEGGESEQARAGQTELRTIHMREYCVTTVAEGAAGSIYHLYAYAFALDEGVGILTFSTRMPQCANYDEPERRACETEQATLDLDGIVDRIAQSVHVE